MSGRASPGTPGTRLPKKFRRERSQLNVSGSASPGRSDADTSRCARSRPPVPAPGRSRRHLRVNTLDGHAARSREPTDGPVPALPPPPPRNAHADNPVQKLLCVRGAGSGSGTRARVRLERRNEPRARDESRASPERAIRTINPAETLDGSRYRRVFASFGPRDEALTPPRVN